MIKAGELGKTIFDFTLTFIGTICISPLLAYIAYRIKKEDPGPVIFKHMRVGKNGKSFPCYKFRSMCVDAKQMLEKYLRENPEARMEWERDFKLKNDPRVTPIGEFLRRTSLDELPQIFNVLKGEMSLVGPRPIVQEEVPRYGKHIKKYYSVKPGITGLWQVSGRSDISYPERVALDVEYVVNRNLPEKFYLKCNHVSGGNVACFDKKVFDLEKAKKKLSWYMNINQYYITREWQYKNIKPKIICEKFLENNDSKPLVDYKFYCFNGNPQMVLIKHGTAKIDGSHEDAHLQYENYYDMRLKPLNITDNSQILSENEVIFPSNYQEMKKYATVLAEPFPFVRVDFYEINKKIIFGELTFTCAGGCHNYNPLEFNEKLGSYLDLSKISLYE